MWKLKCFINIKTKFKQIFSLKENFKDRNGKK